MKNVRLLFTLLTLVLFVSSCEMTPEKIQPFENSMEFEPEPAAEAPDDEPLPPPD